MRTKDFVMLEKRFLHNLPNFIIKGPLLFIAPIEHTLKGFHFDGSNFDKKSFYVNVFFMPLYKPSQHIYLTFGRRLGDGGGDRWSTDEVGFETRLEAAMQGAPVLGWPQNSLERGRCTEAFLRQQPPLP